MIRLCLVLLLFALCPAGAVLAAPPLKWAVYYGADETWERFKEHDIVVFDGDHHPAIRPLTGQGTDVLAYLSLLEVDPSREYHAALRRGGLLLEQSLIARPVIDVRKPEWIALLVEEIIPLYVRKGFTGLMLDTADTAVYLESRDPVRYRGLKEATALTIRHIRMHYPYLKIMLNRGFDMLDTVNDDVNMVLAESIYIDSRTLPAKPFPATHYAEVLETLRLAKERNPSLQLLSLDYWDMKDTAGVQEIYSRQRAAGLIPYVSTHDLQLLYAEPQ